MKRYALRTRNFLEGYDTIPGVFFHQQFPGRVVLSFDDGPTEMTPRVAKLLSQHGIQGVFFMLGQRVAREPSIVREVDAAGHIIAIHSFSHPSFAELNARQMGAEIDQTRQAIDRALRDRYPKGYPHRYFRPPFGSTWTREGSPRARRRLVDTLTRRWMMPVFWQVDSGDGQDTKVDHVIERFYRELETSKGGVVLFHDTHKNLLPTLEKLIEELPQKGFQFSRLSDLIGGF
ncbi:MAG: polysaccharide deacetylase family protein [Deltaproteobacteria bacterium]|nr:polysaccharide deacetylase family protein [bacterium]MCB9475900.1 polysaccharide deacetylase family protein [Deltaproteobacteria bacterium]MCB9479707.1 polysaccharide deacetylase family protein [Deltaproteobacteria bacterium]MCB9488038.1 polysaccharide deacetylase family protein [Deltaproteobacteria bacterium]